MRFTIFDLEHVEHHTGRALAKPYAPEEVIEKPITLADGDRLQFIRKTDGRVCINLAGPGLVEMFAWSDNISYTIRVTEMPR